VNVSFFAPFAYFTVKSFFNRKVRKERKGNTNLSTIDYYKKLKIELGKLKNTGGVLEQVFSIRRSYSL